MPIAYNEKTGEALRLDDAGQWVPTKIAENPQTGERVAFDGKEWTSIGKKAEGLGFLRGLDRLGQQGFMAGYADEYAGLAAGLVQGTKALFDSEKEFTTEFGKGYERRVRQHKAEEERFREEHPVAATTAEVLGGVASLGGGTVKAAQLLPQVPKLLRYGAAGVASGAVAGSGYAEDGERIEGAIDGGMTGGLVGAGLPIAGKIVTTTAQPVVRMVADRVGNGPARAVDRKLLEALQQDGKTPAQVKARLSRLGPDATIADAAGENTAGLLETVANQPGKGRQMATRVLEARQRGQGKRIMQSANRELGDAGFHETLDELNTARRSVAAPLYDEAYAKPFVGSDIVDTLLRRPSMKAALARAHRIAAEEGRDPSALGLTFNEAGDVVFTKTPSMQTLDYVKRGLDDVVESFRDKTTGKLVLDESGRAINATRAAFVRELRDLNPKYGEALDAWGGPSQLMDAMVKGRGFANADSEITEKVVASLSQAEREAFLLGVRKGIEDIVDRTGSTADAVRKLIGTPKMQKALEAAFPDTPAFRRFVADLLREAALNKTRNTVLGNSATSRRLAAREDLATDPQPLIDLAQGNLVSAGGNALRSLAKRFNRMPAAQVDELAGTLLSTDHGANASALRRLAEQIDMNALTDRQRQALTTLLLTGTAQQIPAQANR